ncbi:hypothetical protein CEY12_18835 [Chryseobacterium sp. T16E-39]|uniref:hypothetical protein n=1 Tax=Chryseobacterium sp. T16E-39 TaxID=2015076 RepID=UPI000B5B2BF1|nr:hypothetical protein [Chryseobacterium sp. T16E-39]ASK32029.1 hypothetical protein CEY12_18835 [Chryseobacterium sp. T16E-39]
MELPFYLSYKEFENQYYNNLEKWFEEYLNTSETDFLKSMADMYRPYLYYNFANDRVQADASTQIKDCFFPYYEKIGLSFCTNCENDKDKKSNKKEMNHVFEWKTISMMEYAQHVLDKINRYFLKNGISPKNENVLDYINNCEIVTSRDGAGYCVNYSRHQRTISFLKAYLPCYGQTVDITVYRDFVFSVVQIAQFIDQKLRAIDAIESTIYNKLKSDARFKLQMSHQFLTICN